MVIYAGKVSLVYNLGRLFRSPGSSTRCLPCLSHRLRKDPLDTMDGSFKVMLGFNKVFNGSALKDFSAAMEEGVKDPEEEKRKEEEAKAKEEAAAAPKKAGAWGGLPGFGR